MRPALSIKTKLIIEVSFLTIAIIIVISYMAFEYLETNSKRMIAREQFAVVSLLANEIDDRLINAHAQLIILSKKLTPVVLSNPAESLDFLHTHPDIRAVFNNGLFLFDSKCAIVAEIPQTPVRVGMDFSFREYLTTTIATRKPYISNPYVSSLPHHHPAVMLTAPVFNPQGELIGVLGGSIDLMSDNILGRLADMKYGKTGYFVLVTKDRNIILHPDRNRILKNDIPVGANRALEQAIAGFDMTEETVTSRGLHAIASYTHLKAKEWFVGANLPVVEAYESIYQVQKTLLIVVAVIIIVVPIVMWYLMNLLTRPLLAFTRHVESITGKRGEERLFPIASLDEIGRLNKAFNEMVVNLDVQQTEIESQKERLAVTLRSIADGVIVTDIDGNLVLMNAAAERLTGWQQDDAIGSPLQNVFISVDEKSRQPLFVPVTAVVASGTIESMRLNPVLISRDGSEHFISGSCAPIRDRESRTIGTILVFQDSTDKRRLEEESARAEKLESIGILAGGIAHDYNNILTAIIGNISLAKLSMEKDSKVQTLLERVEKAAMGAKDLGQQLLAFAKGGAPIKKTTSVAELITDTVSFALRGSNVRSDFLIAPDLWLLDIDRGQISQVMSNLAINAKQAMPDGGIIEVRAENCRLEGNNPQNLTAGRYVKISLRDTGQGIPEADLSRIFDPYFTTKPGGSGLGLSMSYTILKKHQGHIGVHSSDEGGTTFDIYLPASESERTEEMHLDSCVFGGTGSLLVMDDDEAVKDTLCQILNYLGYSAEFVGEGLEAVRR